MKAIVLSIGSELLRGDIVDTNAAFLTRELTQLGIRVLRVEQTGDDLDGLTATVRRAMKDADLTLSTGGLGPTQDDLTRDAIAAALGEEMFTDAGLKADIEARFASMQRRMPDSNFRQALRIPSCDALPNPNGTAPGWYVSNGGHLAIAMPGPPSEMQPMWRDSVLPRLSSSLSGATATQALITFGVGESTVEQRIARVIGRRADVIVATYAKQTGVEVHLTAHAATLEEARTLVQEAEHEIRNLLGDAVYGTGDDTLGKVVGRLLDGQNLTVAVMESATGGELSSMITNYAGSAQYFAGGIVAYTPEMKAAHGVDSALFEKYGIISPEVAAEMATAARTNVGADIGLGTTGIAGEESVEGKPAGTCFIAMSTNGCEQVREIHRPGRRDTLKRYFAQCALDLLRRHLEESEVRAR